MVLVCKTVPRLFLRPNSSILKGQRVAGRSQTRPVAAGQPTQAGEIEVRHQSFTSEQRGKSECEHCFHEDI